MDSGFGDGEIVDDWFFNDPVYEEMEEELNKTNMEIGRLGAENVILKRALKEILKVKRTIDANLFDMERIHDIANKALDDCD